MQWDCSRPMTTTGSANSLARWNKIPRALGAVDAGGWTARSRVIVVPLSWP